MEPTTPHATPYETLFKKEPMRSYSMQRSLQPNLMTCIQSSIPRIYMVKRIDSLKLSTYMNTSTHTHTIYTKIFYMGG